MFSILKIYIAQYQQFKNFVLDLTYPNGSRKGEPLDRVCFIGKNGTGKSTLLTIIESRLGSSEGVSINTSFIKARCNNSTFFVVSENKRSGNMLYQEQHLLKEEVEQREQFEEIIYNFLQAGLRNPKIVQDAESLFKDFEITGNEKDEFLALMNDKSNKLLITIPAETNQLAYRNINEVPNTNINEALGLFNGIDYKQNVSIETVNSFWKTLVFLITKRQNERNKYRDLPENQARTLGDVNQEFDRNNPKILDKISEIWNKILERLGLEFDAEKASTPIHLNENLRAFIDIKATGEIVSYQRLSTGVRDFIFKLGHVCALYFGRNVSQGYLLIDEPENSLFPDILYNLIDLYSSVTQNTQIFIATHSPIIAAQFEASERIILDFADDGSITQKRGTTPIGDDPNDILRQDFGLRSLLGKEGIQKWEEYVALKILVQNTSDRETKAALIQRLLSIGNAYNFGNTEIE